MKILGLTKNIPATLELWAGMSEVEGIKTGFFDCGINFTGGQMKSYLVTLSALLSEDGLAAFQAQLQPENWPFNAEVSTTPRVSGTLWSLESALGKEAALEEHLSVIMENFPDQLLDRSEYQLHLTIAVMADTYTVSTTIPAPAAEFFGKRSIPIEVVFYPTDFSGS